MEYAFPEREIYLDYQYGTLTKEKFDAEIEKGMEDIKAGRVYSVDGVEAVIREK